MKPTTTVGMRELKNRLSLYLRKVKAGQTVVITEHGKPMGQIVPIREDTASRLKTLVDAGIVEWNGKSVPLNQPKAINRVQQLVSDLVLEDRE